jgi:hypothetical protein
MRPQKIHRKSCLTKAAFSVFRTRHPESYGRSPTRKSFLYPDFTNRPDQKSEAWNLGDSANPNTKNRNLLFFLKKELY